MKLRKLLTLLLLVGAPLVVAQKRVEPAQKERDARVEEGVFLKVGKEMKVEGEELRLAFVSVKEDSRCPEGATCVWAGNARAHLVARNAKDECAEFDLNTHLDPHDYEFGGYRISLARLTPVPSLHGLPRPDDYVATIVVKKIEKDKKK